MQEIDPDTAKTRIDAMKEQLTARLENIKDPARLARARERIQTIARMSKELSALEGEVASAEEAEKQDALTAILGAKPKLKADDIDLSKKGPVDPEIIEEERKGKILGGDKEYQSILVMKTKQEVIDYLAANFGEKGDARQSIENLRAIALEKRKERVFEV